MSRDPNVPQTVGPANWFVRKNNQLWAELPVVHNEFAAVDFATAEGSANWGNPLRVLGFDRLVLVVDYTAGTTTTGFTVAAQVAEMNNPSAPLWYDVYDDRAAPGTLVRRTWGLTGAATSKQAAFEIPTFGAYMRFKAWGAGAAPANGRLLVRAAPLMNAS